MDHSACFHTCKCSALRAKNEGERIEIPSDFKRGAERAVNRARNCARRIADRSRARARALSVSAVSLSSFRVPRVLVAARRVETRSFAL